MYRSVVFGCDTVKEMAQPNVLEEAKSPSCYIEAS